jgi:class 3 adenylate cyclase
MITDEPVRGRTPPPWFRALSGIERHRAFNRGQLPWPPLARLLGTRTTHVVPGGVNVTMPATEALLTGNNQLEITPLMVGALESACDTAVSAGRRIEPRKFTIDPFRPAWLRPGNLLARARVVNSGNLFVFAEVQLEDAEGRHLAHGSMQAVIRLVEPPPPAPPSPLPRVEEPTYETPDPYLRSFETSPSVIEFLEQERIDPATLAGAYSEGRYRIPDFELFGLRLEESAPGSAALSMPASEWFCMIGDVVSPAAISTLGTTSGWSAVSTLYRPGTTLVGLDGIVRFLRPVRPDGRRLRSESVLTEHATDLFHTEGTIRDADGNLIATHSGSYTRLSAAERENRHRQESRRALATLLFTDIVGSTEHAERLGDAAWRRLLEDHKLAVRRELSRHNGTESATAGDGFFVRFHQPAQAIEAARAVLRASARLGVEVRAGIHTGECELEGNRPTGMAVHIAARIQAAAQPGEVLVSSTVKDLAVGSGVRFADRGERNLKGVPDPWRLYAVVD